MDEAGIANMALSAVGARARIASLDEASQEARVCAAWYVTARDEALRDFPWSFANMRAVLVEHDDDPVDDWTYRYALPGDFLSVRHLLAVGSGTNPQPFEMVLSADGSEKTICCNLEPGNAVLAYTRKSEDPELYDSEFLSMFALKLATLVCVPITGDEKRQLALARAYIGALSAAKAITKQEARPTSVPDADWITARGA